MLRTAFFFTLFIPFTLCIILVGLPVSLLSADYLHALGRFWGKGSLRLAGIRLTVEGRGNLLPGQAVIYMPNHQSQFDILALFEGIPGQFRWLAKAELFRIPLFGLAMARAGYIPVNRSDRREAIKSMNDAAARISAGTSVVVFPEGTRSQDGQLLPFKKGGFMLALQSQVPIVPVAILGTGSILPKGSRWLQGGAITVRFLPPVATAGMGTPDRDFLMGRLQETLNTALAGAASGEIS